LHNLGQIYLAQGRYKKAEHILEQSLKIRKKLLGLEHPDTASSQFSLAQSYFAQPYLTKKRYEEAEQLLKDALKTHQKLLGLEHPDTIASLLSLASLYSVPGRYGEPLIRGGVGSF
jgi:tetratricopeptide (TPR) repeat protein